MERTRRNRENICGNKITVITRRRKLNAEKWKTKKKKKKKNPRKIGKEKNGREEYFHELVTGKKIKNKELNWGERWNE